MNTPNPSLRRRCHIPILRRPAWVLFLPAILVLAGCQSDPEPDSRPLLLRQALNDDQRGQLLANRGDWPAAAQAWKSASDTYALLDRGADEGLTLRKQAVALQQAGQLGAAHEAADRAANLHRRLDDEEGWWRNQVLLIQIEAAQGRNEQVTARIEELASRQNSVASPSTRALFLNEVGLWRLRQSDPGQAVRDFTGAVEGFWRAHDDKGMATALANRARAFESLQTHDAAERDWAAALKLFVEEGDPMGIATAMLGRARALFGQNQSPEVARDLATRAAENFHRLQAPAAEAEARRLLGEMGREP